jgi:DNA-binding transcriptional regulator YdaS (Cro superfamily)
MLSASQIVNGLDGTSAAARFFGVKPPSVSEWVKNGAIPEDKLIRKAASLERRVEGFHRRTQFPDCYQEIWPELADRAPA